MTSDSFWNINIRTEISLFFFYVFAKGFNVLDISKFFVIAVCSNPVRFKSRWNLFKQFEQHITKLGAQLIIVEQAFGNREFQLTQKNNPYHVQVRTDQELWHKENMVNIGINYLSQIEPKWEYVAWVDGDVHFTRDDIILETAQQLQHYDVVQMFSHAIDLGPNHELINNFTSFMYMYHQNNTYPPFGTGKGGYYLYGTDKNAYWHPGFAWAAKRSTIDQIQLMDGAILGAGDHHMALALVGQAEKSLHDKCSPGYKKMVMDWQKNANYSIERNVGYVPGTLTHYWHGNKIDRKYWGRWDIINKNQFDPGSDIVKDSFGLWKLNMCHGERSIRLRDEIRQYNRNRNEDSIDFKGVYKN